jgi:hypothetical protein
LLDTLPHPTTLQEHFGLPLVIVPLLARFGALALYLGAETWWEPSGVGVPVEYVGGAGREDEERRIGGGVEGGDLSVLGLMLRQPCIHPRTERDPSKAGIGVFVDRRPFVVTVGNSQ